MVRVITKRRIGRDVKNSFIPRILITNTLLIENSNFWLAVLFNAISNEIYVIRLKLRVWGAYYESVFGYNLWIEKWAVTFIFVYSIEIVLEQCRF